MTLFKILIVTRAFFPTNSPRAHRATELAIELAKQGHNVTVITPKENIPKDFEIKHNLTIKDLGTPKWKVPDFGKSKIGYFFTRLFTRVLQLSIEYPDIELIWMIEKALKNESGYNMLISIASPHPVHWGVALAWKKEIAEKWIADCGDPYALLENDTFKKWFHFRFVEKWFMRKTDFITIPIESARRTYFKEFHKKIKVIPQGLSFPVIKKVERESNNGTITFAYFGNICAYQHYAIPFLKFLNNVKQHFQFIIFTDNKVFFTKYLENDKVKRCEFFDSVERERLLNKTIDIDFFIYFPYKSDSQRSFKLIDYSFLEKPILNFINDQESKNHFFEFLTGNYTNAMYQLEIEQFRIENVAKSFLELD